MTMTRRNGFSLIELVIVIAIMAILMGIAIPMWNHYRHNADLKSAARNIAADIADTKVRATTERLEYIMTFTPSNNTYQIANTGTTKDVTGSGYPVNLISFTTTSTNPDGTPGNGLRFDVRGTTNDGVIVLGNARGSVATITINTTGRTNVAFQID